jgi:hypothetical protein
MASLLVSSERISSLPFMDRFKILTASGKRSPLKQPLPKHASSKIMTVDKHPMTTMVTVQQQTPPPPPYVPAMDQEQDDIENLAEAVKQNSHLVSAISKTGRSLDRKSIIQGIKLVAIAADEYNEGNDTVALDIYLTGLDKIVMALPGKYIVIKSAAS